MAKKKKAPPAKWLAFAARATQYCRDVIAGQIPACKWVKLACQRHLNDLVRARSKDFEYKFDEARAGRYCAKVEKFPHVKGHWAANNELIKLEAWQCFIVCSIFGWVNKQTGLRRFRQAIVLVPRKNAKTTLAAAIGNIMFAADSETGAEVYCGASEQKQAFEVFSPASRMARRAAGFAEYFGITVGKKNMYIIEDGSKFEPVIGEPGDGPSPHCFIHDEFHEQKTWAQYTAAETGMGARQQPLQLIISTAGFELESPCHELQRHLERILEGVIVSERIFGIVFTVDDPEKWSTLEAARQANPNFGVSVLEDYIDVQRTKAVQWASRQNAYKCKNLNIWVNARVAWMNMAKWKACADPSLSLEEFQHEPCYEGLDLGARIDLTSRCKIFVRWKDGARHYYLFSRHYVPIDVANDTEHEHYERWLKQGHMVGHPGPEILLPRIQEELEAESEQFNYARMSFDPHQALQMQQTLKEQLGPDELGNDRVIDLPQQTRYLDPAMKEIEAAVFAGRLHHTGDPVLEWGIGNVLVKPDGKEMIFPRKEDNGLNKIDPASALFSGFYPALAAVPTVGNIEAW